MVSADLEHELHEQLEKLSPERQQEIVEFARSLASKPDKRRGSGADLMPLVGSISKEDLALMSQAIEEAFGHVDPDGWK